MSSKQLEMYESYEQQVATPITDGRTCLRYEVPEAVSPARTSLLVELPRHLGFAATLFGSAAAPPRCACSGRDFVLTAEGSRVRGPTGTQVFPRAATCRTPLDIQLRRAAGHVEPGRSVRHVRAVSRPPWDPHQSGAAVLPHAPWAVGLQLRALPRAQARRGVWAPRKMRQDQVTGRDLRSHSKRLFISYYSAPGARERAALCQSRNKAAWMPLGSSFVRLGLSCLCGEEVMNKKQQNKSGIDSSWIWQNISKKLALPTRSLLVRTPVYPRLLKKCKPF
ncbi:uncharacterized protein LOC131481596 [Ochotona princeps]|uniref:uncharacterized protein LOC131481596 n=1 Tax=Ochotona princeps TaxID=9978 RepID=UPI002714E848|nr:uncharacterized protein LOC131481596 [Ochotona princeps]